MAVRDNLGGSGTNTYKLKGRYILSNPTTVIQTGTNTSTFSMASVPDYDKYPCVVFARSIYPNAQGLPSPAIYMNGAPAQVSLQLSGVDTATINSAWVYQYEPE